MAIETTAEPQLGFDVILFGLGRFGNHIARELVISSRRVLGVDFDPELVHRLREAGHPVVYGDAEDPEFSSTLPLSTACWVISSVPQFTTNMTLLQALTRHGYSGRVAATAHNENDAKRLRDAGCDLIFLPFADAAKEAADKLGEQRVSSLRND